MTRALVAALVLVAAPASAAGGAYKLIVTWYQAGIAVIDYPSKERCEAARLALKRELDAREPGGAGHDIGICIPG